MKKITELTEERWRTIHFKDAYGNRQRDTEEYIGKRYVKGIAPGKRFKYFLIDIIAFRIIILMIYFLFFAISSSDELTTEVMLNEALRGSFATILLMPCLYILFEYKWQKTPGKFLFKTMVIDDYGNRPELSAIFIRALIRIVPFEAFTCLGDSSRGWHDKWSNTWVVTDAELEEIKRIQTEQIGV